MLMEVSAIAFALVFLLFGIVRTVELKGLGVSQRTQRWLTVLHVAGCLLFSSALCVVALDLHETRRTLAFALLVVSLLLLAPGQVMIANRLRRSAKRPDPL